MNENFPDNPQIQVLKSGKTGLFTNYIYKAIPLAFDESMSYYETLCGLLDYLKNVIIPTVNNNADAVAELQTLYEQLRTYVENYFTNLDVQEEINNKLDEMVEDGIFDNILSNYANIEKVYKTTIEMLEDNTIVKGQKIKTLGYSVLNDGGESEFIIEDELNSDYLQYELNNGLYATLIMTNKINSKQFGIIENIDVTNQLQKFFDFAYKYRNKKFDLMGGNYIISNTININPYIEICLKGNSVFTDNNETSNAITFNIISNVNESTNDRQGITHLFDNSNGCLVLSNNKPNIAKTGISINSVSSSPAKRVNCNLQGVQIINYDIGLSLNTFNTYFMQFEMIEISLCRIGVYIGKNNTVNNSGENISFKKCLITRCDCAIYCKTSIRTDFIQTSIDFNSCVLYIPSANISTEVNFIRCWIEGYGFKTGGNLSTFEGFSGIVYATNDNDWYDKNIINFEKCEICHLIGQLTDSIMQGTSLIINMINNTFWYAEDIALNESIGNNDFDHLFISKNVRNINLKNNNYKYTSHLMIDKTLSLTDATLNGETITDEYDTTGNITNSYFNNFDIDTYDTGTTKIRKVIEDNKKCIELVAPYNGAFSTLSIISKNAFLIKDIYRIYANASLKGWKSANDTHINFYIKFFDKDDNLISRVEIGSNYLTNTSSADPLKWIYANRLQDLYSNKIPKNAYSFKIGFKLYALSSSYNDTQIAGTTVHWNDPVYFTGFYSFTE